MQTLSEQLFQKLKGKDRKRYTGWTYDDFLTNVVTSMIRLRNKEKISPDFDDFFIELYCSIEGYCAVWKDDRDNDKVVISHAQFSGNPDANGIGLDVICTTENGHTRAFDDWKNNPEVVIIFNNNAKSPDLFITRTSDFLTEIDISLRALNRNTRKMNLIKVKNSSEKKQIEDAQTAIDNGDFAVIQEDFDITDILQEGTTKQSMVESLTDPNLSDKIQYLVKFWDDTLRQFYNIYGMQENGAAKMAQQSKEEINDGANITSIIPLNKLEARNKSLEKLRVLTGVEDLEFVFSTAWQREEQKKSDELEGDEELRDNIVDEIHEQHDAEGQEEPDEEAEESDEEEDEEAEESDEEKEEEETDGEC